MVQEFTVYGEPVGKGRPRFRSTGRFVQTYTPKKTKDAENEIAKAYKEKYPEGGFGENPCAMKIEAYFPIPVSTKRELAQKMKQGQIRHTKKPDADNVIKIVADALNGLAYSDDKQLTQITIIKSYSDQPRMEIALWET